jgi:hypothetical protein
MKRQPFKILFANVVRFEPITKIGTKGNDKELYCLLFETESDCSMPRRVHSDGMALVKKVSAENI